MLPAVRQALCLPAYDRVGCVDTSVYDSISCPCKWMKVRLRSKAIWTFQVARVPSNSSTLVHVIIVLFICMPHTTHLSQDQMESLLRQSAFRSIVLATASALSMVLTAAQVKDNRRAESSYVCKNITSRDLQTDELVLHHILEMCMYIGFLCCKKLRPAI